MMDKVSKFKKNQGRGTGNILNDLISSKVQLKRTDLTNSSSNKSLTVIRIKSHLDLTAQRKVQNECCICEGGPESCQPLTLQQIEILECFISNSLPFWAASSCSSCSKVLDTLAQLKAKIEHITKCLRSLLRMQNKKQEPVRAVSASGILAPQ